jgi:hypothetical protein
MSTIYLLIRFGMRLGVSHPSIGVLFKLALAYKDEQTS